MSFLLQEQGAVSKFHHNSAPPCSTVKVQEFYVEQHHTYSHICETSHQVS